MRRVCRNRRARRRRRRLSAADGVALHPARVRGGLQLVALARDRAHPAERPRRRHGHVVAAPAQVGERPRRRTAPRPSANAARTREGRTTRSGDRYATRARRSPPAGRARGRRGGRARAAPTAPAGRRPACRRRATAPRRAARAPATASSAVAFPARATTAIPPRARTSARACRAASRAPGSSASSAASRRSASPRACSRTGRRRRRGRCRRASARRLRPAHRRPSTSAGSRPSPGRSSPLASLADQLPPLGGVLPGEQPVERNVGVAVARVAVGERELRRLREDVHELGLAERGDVDPLEHHELLQPRRPLPPRRRLAHRQPAVVDGRRRLERRPPPGEIVARQQPAAFAREAVDLLRHEALVVDAPRALDLVLARAAPCLVEQAPPRRGKRAVPERLSGLRRRQVQLGRARPAAQERFDVPDRRDDRGHDRVPVVGVADRVCEHVLEPPRPEPLEQEQPAAERARGRTPPAGRCPARARARASGTARSSPPAARRPARRARAARPSSAGQITAGRSPPGPFRCGSTTCSTKPAAHAASNALPPRSSTAHPGGGGEPVRRRDRAERPAQLGPRREGHARNSAVSISSGARSSGRTR